MGYSEEEIKKLIDKLENGKSASTRIKAAFELSYTGSPIAIPALCKAYKNDNNSEVRSTALWSISEINVDKIIPLLPKSLQDRDWDVRYESVSIILDCEIVKLKDELSYLLFDEEDSDIRSYAAYTLGQLKAKGILSDLVNALENDESKDVRKSAAEAIGEIDPARNTALKILKTKIINDNNYEVRKACAIALGKIKTKEIMQILLNVLKKDRSSLVRVKILDILKSYEIDEDEFLNILREVIQTDPNSNVRNKAVEIFGEKEAMEDLHNIIKSDYDYDVLLNAREQLDWIAYEKGIDVEELISKIERQKTDLKIMLASIEPIVIADRIAKILTFPINEEDTIEFIDKLIDVIVSDEIIEFREAAASRLSIIRNKYLENRLLELLEENIDDSTRILILRVLHNMGSENAVSKLVEIITSDNNLVVKGLAIEVLLNINIKDNKDLLFNCLNCKIDPNVMSRLMNSLFLHYKDNMKPRLLEIVKKNKSAKIRSKAIEILKNYPIEGVIDILLKVKNEDRSLNTRTVSNKVLEELSKTKNELLRERTSEYNKRLQDLDYERDINVDIYNIDTNQKLTILFAAANPDDHDYLRQGNEIKQIMNVLRQSGKKNKFNIRQEWALTKKDLSRILFEYNPDILHISCHGSFDGSLLLEDDLDHSKSVTMKEIVNIFKICREEETDFNLKLLVISACNSEMLANEISKYVDYVVAMLDTITDESATEFAGQFYEKIVMEKNIKTAFRVGCNFISEKDEDKIPDLFSRIITSQGRFKFN